MKKHIINFYQCTIDKMERIYKNQLRKAERIETLKQVYINILLAKNITNKTKDKLTTEYIKKLQELKQEIIGGK